MHGRETVGITSIQPGKRLKEIVQRLSKQGHAPVVIVEGDSASRARELLKGDRCKIVPIPQLQFAPIEASEHLVNEFQRQKIRLTNWVNVTDQTTNAYLLSLAKLELSFPFRQTYERCRIKDLARQMACQAGCAEKRLSPVRYGTAGHKLIKGRAFVAKPITGTGSRCVRKISKENTWKKYWKIVDAHQRDVGATRQPYGKALHFVDGKEYELEHDFACEPCLEGTMFEIDGYVSATRREICAIGRRLHLYSEEAGFREVGGLIWKPEVGRHPDTQILDWTNRLLDVIEFRSGVFHIEAMYLGERIDLIEINPRNGGGSVPSMVKKVSGIDLGKAVVDLWLDGNARIRRTKPEARAVSYAICYPKKPGTIRVSTGEWIRSWQEQRPITQDDLNRETYLGELHIHHDADFEPPTDEEISRFHRLVNTLPFVTHHE